MDLDEIEVLDLTKKYRAFREDQDREEFWYGKLHGVYGIKPLSISDSYLDGYEKGKAELNQC